MTALDPPPKPSCPRCQGTDLEPMPRTARHRYLCVGCNTTTDGTAAEHIAESRHRQEQANEDSTYRAVRDRHHQEQKP